MKKVFIFLLVMSACTNAKNQNDLRLSWFIDDGDNIIFAVSNYGDETVEVNSRFSLGAG